MKNLFAKLLLPVAICATAIALAGAAVPPMTVLVTKDGKVAYKGTTNASGTFSTGKLEPGNYIVQFNSSAVKTGQMGIVISAGKKKVTADSVAGDKLAKGGVAMKLDVGAGLNITGQVVNGPIGGAQTAAGSNARVKIVNGKRYVWVGPETGSNMGGRWVEEGSANVPQQNMSRMSNSSVQGMQDRGSEGGVSGP